MKQFSPKYLRMLSCLILTGYVYLSAFNILHYHAFDLLSGNYAVEAGDTTGRNDVNGFNDLNFQCTSHQNYSSLHSFSTEQSKTDSGWFENISQLTFSNNHTYSDSEFFKAHPLRAPPLS